MISAVRSKKLYLLFLCWLTYVLAYCNRLNFSVAMLGIQNETGLTTASLSSIGMLFFFAYAFGQLVNGRIGDLVPSKIMVCAGLAVSSLCNIMFSRMSGFWPLAIIWTLNGLALSALWGPMARQLSGHFSPKFRDALAMIMSSSMAVGYLLSWGTSSTVSGYMGWRGLFVLPGIASLVFAVLLLIVFPYEKNTAAKLKTTSDVNNDESSPASVYRVRDIWGPMGLGFLIAASVAHGVIKDGISLFSPYILSITGGETTSLFMLLVPLLNVSGSLSAFVINKLMRMRTNLSLTVLFGLGFALMLALVILRPYLAELTLMLLIGCMSACMYAVNMLLLGSIPMRFAQFGLVSSVAGILDFSSYMAASASAGFSGRLLESSGIGGVLILWCVFTVPAIISMLLRHRLINKTRASEI